MYANTYYVHNVHNSSVVGRGGGGCLQGLSHYFPCFQQLPYSKWCSSNNRSKIKDLNHVKCNNVKTQYYIRKVF